MSYGEPDRGNHAWTLPEEDSAALPAPRARRGHQLLRHRQRLLRRPSEEILGRALKDSARRDEVVIATKVHGRMRPGPTARACRARRSSPRSTTRLRRLGTDYVDLYQIHRFDPRRRSRRRCEALHDVVRAGKVRYLGAVVDVGVAVRQGSAPAGPPRLDAGSSRCRTTTTCIYREEEREMLPLCADEGIGVIPWSPLARGKLTRDWDETTNRSENDEFGKTLYRDSDADVVGRRGRGSQSAAASRAPRSRSPGCAPTRWSRADRRRDQAPPPRRRGRRARPRPHRRRGRRLEAPYEPHEVARF